MAKSKGDELVLDLGRQPVSNRFVDLARKAVVPSFPMRLMVNRNDGMVRLETPFPVEEVRPRYEWITCFEPEDHLDDMVSDLVALPGITRDSVFAGYSFKDDSTLERLKHKGYEKQWRLDPEGDLGVTDRCANIETYQSVFNPATAEKIRKNRGCVDVLVVRHVLEHAYRCQNFMSALASLVKPTGYIVWEIPDCEAALNGGDCTTIWEEHTHYFTKYTFRELLRSSGFNIVQYQSVQYPLENSIIAVTEGKRQVNPIHAPTRVDVDRECQRAVAFGRKVKERKKTIESRLAKLEEQGVRVAMFGAGHLAAAFISIMDVSRNIEFVIDDNPNKTGMLMPVGDVPIVGSDALYSNRVGVCLLSLNPQNHYRVIEKHSGFSDKGGIFLSIFPGTSLDVEKMV